MYNEIGDSPRKLREMIKTGCAMGLYWSGIDRLVGAEKGFGKAPLVIGYHRIVANYEHSAQFSIAPQLTSTHVFEKHLDWLGRHYAIVSLDELVKVLEKGGSRKPVAAITFDDGYSDVFHNALPVLVRKGMPAAVFVVADLVGTNKLLVHDELYLLMNTLLPPGRGDLERYAASLPLSPDKLSILQRISQGVPDPFLATRTILERFRQSEILLLLDKLRGEVTISDAVLQEFGLLDLGMLDKMIKQGITVGSHSKTHALLANSSPAVIKTELEESRRFLEQSLGVDVKHFAYPDGLFNGDVVLAAAAAGYRSAYTTCNHQDRRHPLLTIPRKMLWERSSMDVFGHFSAPILRCQINGIFDPASKCQRQHWA